MRKLGLGGVQAQSLPESGSLEYRSLPPIALCFSMTKDHVLRLKMGGLKLSTIFFLCLNLAHQNAKTILTLGMFPMSSPTVWQVMHSYTGHTCKAWLLIPTIVSLRSETGSHPSLPRMMLAIRMSGGRSKHTWLFLESTYTVAADQAGREG